MPTQRRNPIHEIARNEYQKTAAKPVINEQQAQATSREARKWELSSEKTDKFTSESVRERGGKGNHKTPVICRRNSAFKLPHQLAVF